MTNPTRQIGEAVAWRCRIDADSDWYPLAAEYVEKRIADCLEVQPLIPASDLSTITRQRDEAVRLLRPFGDAAAFWEPLFDDAEVMMKQPQFLERWRALHGRKAAVPQFVVGDLKRARAFLATVEDKP